MLAYAKALKGQTTFELIVIMVVILIFATAIFIDFGNKMAGVVVGAIKEKIIESYPGCQFSLALNGREVNILNQTCTIDKNKIADEVEKAFCGSANGDNEISCYGVVLK